MPIVIGDARLTLTREPDHSFDLIIVDAYTSDAIPIHLATREAMAIYKAKITPTGVVMMHISNRHLELASVITGIAAANGLQTWVYDRGDTGSDDDYMFTSEVAISAARLADIGELAYDGDWQLRKPDSRPAHLDRRLFQYSRGDPAQTITAYMTAPPVTLWPANPPVPGWRFVSDRLR